MPGIGDRIKASFDAWIEKQENERKKKNPKKMPNQVTPTKVGGGLIGRGQVGQLAKIDKE